MKLIDVKQSILYKISQSKKAPTDEVLLSFINEACLYVANRCIPQVLLKDSEVEFSEKIFRKLDNGKFIAFPEYPSLANPRTHLFMDEELTYAVINYVVFLISHNIDYKQMADEEIAIYCTNFSEEQYE